MSIFLHHQMVGQRIRKTNAYIRNFNKVRSGKELVLIIIHKMPIPIKQYFPTAIPITFNIIFHA